MGYGAWRLLVGYYIFRKFIPMSHSKTKHTPAFSKSLRHVLIKYKQLTKRTINKRLPKNMPNLSQTKKLSRFQVVAVICLVAVAGIFLTRFLLASSPQVSQIVH